LMNVNALGGTSISNGDILAIPIPGNFIFIFSFSLYFLQFNLGSVWIHLFGISTYDMYII
jgi:hypothetical protein